MRYPMGNIAHGGTMRTVEYNEVGRVSALRHETEIGNKSAIAYLDQQFEYDELGRLVHFYTGDTDQNFFYDLNGNRTFAKFGRNIYSNKFDFSNNRLLSTTGPFPAKNNKYDNSGDVIDDGNSQFGYDYQRRLNMVKTGSNTIEYRYNGLNQRVWKSGKDSSKYSGEEYFVYDDSGNLIGEYDSDGKVIQETIYLYNLPVVLMRRSEKNGLKKSGIYYIYTDHIFAPRVIVDSSDNEIVWRWDISDPFGVNNPVVSKEFNNSEFYNLRFPGQYYDKETNLHHNGARDYDPQIGRYIEPDPLGLAGGINIYDYVDGNPISRIDPTGLSCVAVNGTVTCDFPNGPRITFPRPNNWPDRIQPNNINYHEYNEWVKTGGVNKKCMEEYIQNHPTPGSPNPATSEGTLNNASPSWAPPDVASPVMSYTRSYNGSPIIVNVTLPGHPLFPGYVARTIDESGLVNNYGEGLGWLQAPYSPFSRLINNIWQGLTDEAIKHCSCHNR